MRRFKDLSDRDSATLQLMINGLKDGIAALLEITIRLSERMSEIDNKPPLERPDGMQ